MTQPPYPGSPDPDSSEQPGGQTPPPAPQQQSPYGAPQYGAPQYGAPQQQPYGAPSPYGYGQPHPGGPGNDQPSRGMAIAALVLSFFACTVIAGIVSIVLAILVLVRGKDGRNHGKGLAIGAIIVSVLVLAATVVGIVLLAIFGSTVKNVDDLKVGDCISSDNLNVDDFGEGFGLLTSGECIEDHDAEVLATTTLTAQQADEYAQATTAAICTEVVTSEPGAVEKLTDDLTVLSITEDERPSAGDHLACVALRVDGGKLTEPLG